MKLKPFKTLIACGLNDRGTLEYKPARGLGLLFPAKAIVTVDGQEPITFSLKKITFKESGMPEFMLMDRGAEVNWNSDNTISGFQVPPKILIFIESPTELKVKYFSTKSEFEALIDPTTMQTIYPLATIARTEEGTPASHPLNVPHSSSSTAKMI